MGRDFNGLPQFLQRLAASPGFSKAESGSGATGEQALAKQISVEILKRIAGVELMLPAGEMILAAVQKNFTHLSRRLHMFFYDVKAARIGITRALGGVLGKIRGVSDSNL